MYVVVGPTTNWHVVETYLIPSLNERDPPCHTSYLIPFEVGSERKSCPVGARVVFNVVVPPPRRTPGVFKRGETESSVGEIV